jgi:hypothetical protein
MKHDRTPVPQNDPLEDAVAAWTKAQILFDSPSWNGKPAGRNFAEMLSERRDLEPQLCNLLNHEDQLVVAYAILTLELMGSRVVGDLPKELLVRNEKVTVIMGSFGDKMELGAFARHRQKEWNKRTSPE